MRLWCFWRLRFLWYEFGGGSLELWRVWLKDWLSDRSDIVVKEEIVGTCGLSEWVYRGVVIGGVIGRVGSLVWVSIILYETDIRV